ncbi:MAG: carboxypeptidase regulatory-like domain-containing protein, partial [Intrasporangiaceae bacterium]|nr:carboxypeptidase regulatory-like domain-containing protein [Intrasporangiaceae bacterium]
MSEEPNDPTEPIRPEPTDATYPPPPDAGGHDEPASDDATEVMDPVQPRGPVPLRGDVVDDATDQPVADANVQVTDPSGAGVSSVSTVADGRFGTAPLPADRYNLEVAATGYGTARAVVDHPGGRVRIRLATVALGGRVSAADLGPTDPFTAEVEVLDGQGRVVGHTRTEANGTFRVTGLPSMGTLHLVVRAEGYFVERRVLRQEQLTSPVGIELLPAELAGRVVA